MVPSIEEKRKNKGYTGLQVLLVRPKKTRSGKNITRKIGKRGSGPDTFREKLFALGENPARTRGKKRVRHSECRGKKKENEPRKQGANADAKRTQVRPGKFHRERERSLSAKKGKKTPEKSSEKKCPRKKGNRRK